MGRAAGRGFAAWLAVMGLVGCAGQGGTEAGLADQGFPQQGALYGAGLGAAAGCATVLLQSDRDWKDCMKRAAVGGAVGAAAGTAAGYGLRERNRRHAADEAGLNGRLQTAQGELDAARRASEQAERSVREHEATLARLDREVAAGAVSQGELRQAVRAAKRDEGEIRQARDALNRNLAGLDRELAAPRGTGDKARLIALRDQLREERARLDRQLQTLAGALDAADGVG